MDRGLSRFCDFGGVFCNKAWLRGFGCLRLAKPGWQGKEGALFVKAGSLTGSRAKIAAQVDVLDLSKHKLGSCITQQVLEERPAALRADATVLSVSPKIDGQNVLRNTKILFKGISWS